MSTLALFSRMLGSCVLIACTWFPASFHVALTIFMIFTMLGMEMASMVIRQSRK